MCKGSAGGLGNVSGISQVAGIRNSALQSTRAANSSTLNNFDRGQRRHLTPNWAYAYNSPKARVPIRPCLWKRQLESAQLHHAEPHCHDSAAALDAFAAFSVAKRSRGAGVDGFS